MIREEAEPLGRGLDSRAAAIPDVRPGLNVTPTRVLGTEGEDDPGPREPSARADRGHRVGTSEALILGLIVAVGLALRLYWVRSLPMPPISDFETLVDMTRTLARGEWPARSYGWIFHGPGLALVHFPIAVVTDSLTALRLANVAFQLGMIVAVWWLARSLFSPRAGLGAAAAAALVPGMFTLTAVIAKDNLSMLLLPLSLALLMRLDRPGRVLAAGATIGLLALVRGNFLPFVLVVVLLVAVEAYRRRRPSLIAAVLVGVGAVLVPVVGLNLHNGGPALPTANGPWMLWLTNNERATGRWFNPNEDDDSPFHGIGSTFERMPVERKLGTQFVVANPIRAIANTWDRHAFQWRRDAAGLLWTYDRATPEQQAKIPLTRYQVWAVTAWGHLLLLLLATVGAIRGGARRRVAPLVTLPLLFGIGTLAISEANLRYHLTFTPLLCVLAGAAFLGRPSADPADAARAAPGWTGGRWFGRLFGTWAVRPNDRTGLLVLVTGVAFVAVAVAWLAVIVARGSGPLGEWPTNSGVTVWLILAVALALVVPVVAAWGPRVARASGGLAVRYPARATAAAVVVAIVLSGASLAVMARANAVLDELAAVAPAGWTHYQVDSEGTSIEQGLRLVSSGTRGDVRQVSYPDGVLLDFEGTPLPGDRTVLSRELTGLEVGERYTFYLHVYDPGVDGDPSEGLEIRLNGEVVWRRPADSTGPAAWRYVTTDWVADGAAVEIVVERRAGSGTARDDAVVPVVRTLHLYPLY